MLLDQRLRAEQRRAAVLRARAAQALAPEVSLEVASARHESPRQGSGREEAMEERVSCMDDSMDASSSEKVSAMRSPPSQPSPAMADMLARPGAAHEPPTSSEPCGADNTSRPATVATEAAPTVARNPGLNTASAAPSTVAG